MRSRRAVLALVGIALVSSMPMPMAGAGEDLCARFGAPAVGGTVGNPALTEISGLAASHRHAGVLWTHNDSGGAPAVYALGEDGSDLGAYALEGAEATDWEDIAVGPGPEPDVPYVYAADIGDNEARRQSLTVYRAPEPTAAPDGAGGTLTGVEAIGLRYPGGPSDAEALLVDPRTGDLVVVTKSYAGSAHVLHAPAAALVDGATVDLTDEGVVSVRLADAVTGGDVAPDGSFVLLRTYGSVLAFPVADGGTVTEALAGPPCSAPHADERQGEAVAVTSDGAAYVTISEGTDVPVNRVAIEAPATTTTRRPPQRPRRTTGSNGAVVDPRGRRRGGRPPRRPHRRRRSRRRPA